VSLHQQFDAIVVGASFAGLAVARRLRGRVLLLDRHEVGAVQTSACGTPAWVPRWLGVEDSVLQVHERLDVRTPRGTVSYDLSAVPFCTFDYGRFTRGLLAQSSATFLRAAVTGLDHGAVITTRGRFTASVIVDASGWRGILVGAATGRARSPRHYSFGLETAAPIRGDRLTFVVDERVIRQGLAWIFPAGAGSLIGLGSYTGASRLGPALRRLVDDLGTRASEFHGAFFPNRMLRPTVNGLFAVGDAAGQCLPLTAEGIRPALYFGDHCGALVQRVLDGELTLESALGTYARRVLRYRRAYAVLRTAQALAAHAPGWCFDLFVGACARWPLLPCWWPRYGTFGRAVTPAPAS
jgi:flavin-dependent dehydrogenase